MSTQGSYPYNVTTRRTTDNGTETSSQRSMSTLPSETVFPSHPGVRPMTPPASDPSSKRSMLDRILGRNRGTEDSTTEEDTEASRAYTDSEPTSFTPRRANLQDMRDGLTSEELNNLRRGAAPSDRSTAPTDYAPPTTSGGTGYWRDPNSGRTTTQNPLGRSEFSDPSSIPIPTSVPTVPTSVPSSVSLPTSASVNPPSVPTIVDDMSGANGDIRFKRGNDGSYVYDIKVAPLTGKTVVCRPLGDLSCALEVTVTENSTGHNRVTIDQLSFTNPPIEQSAPVASQSPPSSTETPQTALRSEGGISSANWSQLKDRVLQRSNQFAPGLSEQEQREWGNAKYKSSMNDLVNRVKQTPSLSFDHSVQWADHICSETDRSFAPIIADAHNRRAQELHKRVLEDTAAYLKSNMQGTLTQELANPLRAEKDHWRWQTANGAWESREDIRTARENTFLHHQGSLQTRYHFDNNDTGKDKLHRIASYLADRDFLVSANPNLTQEARNDQMTEWEAAAITDQNVLTREEASRAGRSWTSWLLGRNS